jgi:hypothetical protein
MFGIKINDTFLSLYPNTTFGFELSNPAYLGDSIAEIGNGLVFSTKVPMKGVNVTLLQYPHVVENVRRFVKDLPCSLWKNNRLIFNGFLNVTKAITNVPNPSAEVSMVINALAPLKTLKLNQLEMGSIPTANVLSLALETVLHPLYRSFIFYPLHNTEYSEGKLHQNQWDCATQAFATLTFQNRMGETLRRETMTTPHLRVDAILAQMFRQIGYTFRNGWQVNDELKLLTQVGYGAMHTIFNEFMNSTFQLNRALSDTACAVWLGRLCRAFALVPLTSPFTKTVDLIPIRDLLKRAVRHDWTRYARHGSELTESNNFPSALGWKKNNIVPEFSDKTIFWRWDIFSAAFHYNSPEGIYRNWGQRDIAIGSSYYHPKRENQYDISNVDLVYPDSLSTLLGGDGEEWTIEIETLPQANLNFGIGNTYYNYIAPITKTKGKLLDSDVNTPDQLMFFRGMHAHKGYTFPLATSESNGFLNITCLGNPCRYDLTWAGENGILNRFWKEFLHFLQNKRDQTVSIGLPLDDLIQFSFADKIRLGNMDYFVKKVRGNLAWQGDIVECEADLVSVI